MAVQATQIAAGPRRLVDMLPMALSLLETMPGGAIMYDHAGTVLGINGNARRLFGVKARDVLGRPITMLYSDSNWQAIVRTGLPSGAQRILRSGTTCVRIEVPVFADGRVVAVLGHFIGRDIGILREVLSRLPEGESDPQAPENNVNGRSKPEEPDSGVGHATLSDIRGNSRSIREAKSLAAKAARTDMPVLIQGEPGTEIEAFAQAIHHTSERASGDFVVVNSRAATESLLMADLFGLQSGGEEQATKGKLDLAAGGTLYLEEISEMPLGVQSRLVRAMQERGIGQAAAGAGTVRLVASSHRDLAGLVAGGFFREDLYYRLNVIRLDIPPLRARPEDIRALVDGYVVRLNHLYANHGWNRRLGSDGLEMMLRYSWPGNVTELEGVVSRAYCLSDGEEILPKHLPPALQQISQVPTEAVGHKSLEEIVTEVERGVILQALRITGHNKSRTAKLLGLPRSSFYEKLARYGLMTRGN